MTTGFKAEDRQDSQPQVRKPRTGDKVEDKGLRQQQTDSLFFKKCQSQSQAQSREKAAKSRVGEKVGKRFQSPEQMAKLRTGVKVKNRRQSRGQANKLTTGEKAQDRQQS